MNRYEIKRERYAKRKKKATPKLVNFLQFFLFSRIMDYFLGVGLETEDDGRLKLSTSNIRKSNGVSLVIEAATAASGNKITNFFLRGIKNIIGFNRQYFSEDIRYDESIDERVIRLTLESLGWDAVNNKVIGGWAAGLSATEAIKQEVFQQINIALGAKMTLPQFRNKFKDSFTGAKGLGVLERYYGTKVRDIFYQIDRRTQLIYAQELGLRYAFYAGTIKDNTRDFCLLRVGNLYTIEEILEWDELEWKGKSGPVLADAGGFNCRHHFHFISTELALTLIAQGTSVNQFNKGVILI